MLALPEPLTLRLDQTHPAAVAPVEPSADYLGRMVRDLERHLGSERVTFQRIPPLGWECRTWNGKVGRGMTLSDALHDLVAQFGQHMTAVAA